jgi:predicted secreted protein
MTEYSDPAVIIQEQVGNRFNITLESAAASSGFTWKPNYDPTFLREMRPREYVRRSEAIGAGTEERFEFEAIKAGGTTIAMIYQREWKPVPQDTRTFKVSISEV